MQKLEATIKLPDELVEEYISQIAQLGIDPIDIISVPYEQFTEESRLNYDCVFPQMWADHIPVSYVRFSFEDTPEGRQAAFNAEYNIMQVPLNLRYSFDE